MSLVSMTGYGRGTAQSGDLCATAEVSTVNRKQLDVSLNLPRLLQPLEAGIMALVRGKVNRGRVSLAVTLSGQAGTSVAKLTVNESLARSLVEQCRSVAGHLHIDDRISVGDLLRVPGIMMVEEVGADLQQVEPLVLRAVRGALDELVTSRTREGVAMSRELLRWLKHQRKTLTAIRKRAPALVRDYRDALRQRVAQLAADVDIPADRLEREVVLFADRTDIQEEIARLGSHLDQAETLLTDGGPVGRNLDFLAQEILREINTIGSKCSDRRIAENVVGLKADLERFREQVQNIE